MVECEVDDDLYEEGVTLCPSSSESLVHVIARAEVSGGELNSHTLGCLPLLGVFTDDGLLFAGYGSAIVNFRDVHDRAWLVG